MPATAASWKNQPFVEGTAIAYVRDFSPEQFARLREGLVPVVMEDKWFAYFDAPYLYFHRSWTGQPAYRVALAPKEGGAVVTEALWNSAPSPNMGAAYAASLLDFLIAFHLLGENRTFPLPESITDAKAALFRHSVGGYRRSPPSAKPPGTPAQQRRWWKFW
jgi:hypothetical protein